MEILIALSKALGLTLLLMSPIICIFMWHLSCKKEDKNWELEHRKLFGGDLYEPKHTKE